MTISQQLDCVFCSQRLVLKHRSFIFIHCPNCRYSALLDISYVDMPLSSSVHRDPTHYFGIHWTRLHWEQELDQTREMSHYCSVSQSARIPTAGSAPMPTAGRVLCCCHIHYLHDDFIAVNSTSAWPKQMLMRRSQMAGGTPSLKVPSWNWRPAESRLQNISRFALSELLGLVP
jgi:hypothetical protein